MPANPSSAKRTRANETPARAAETVDTYIGACPSNARTILQRIRAIVRKEAPDAEEKISYRMPAYVLDGAFIYFAAFKTHIGMYPPVKGDERLRKDLAAYRGEKGNLRFALDEPIPYPLIRRVVRCRLEEHQARLAARRRR
jgi:uncharacterized protein YdhG (YjbR/CyaY superfamily)